jgi:glutathione S-transferase
LYETGAILLWLADTHGALAPVSNDPPRAAFLKWLFWLSNTLHADLRILFYPEKYTGPDASAQTALRDGIQQRLRTHLTLLERLAAEAPIWMSPAKPSAVSLYAACLLRWMALYPRNADRSWFRITDTPHLHRLLAALETRASTQTAQAAEGLGETPFTAPHYPTPPQGSAT